MLQIKLLFSRLVIQLAWYILRQLFSSISGSGEYLPPLRLIIVKYSEFQVSKYTAEMPCVVSVISIDDTGLAHEKANSCQGSPLCGPDKYGPNSIALKAIWAGHE